MKFGILGPLAVWDDDRELALGGARQRGLLAVLLLRANELVPTVRIVDELWGGTPPATAVKTVQVYVSQLRKLLGEGAIETRSPGYLLRVGDDDLDLTRFEAGLAEGRRLLAEAEPARAAAVLRAALGLWRGPALADFAGEPFAATESTRLEDLRVAAQEQRLEAELALGLHAQAVPELEALVREHPLRESLRGLLMLALYRGGRQVDALAVYQDARRTLVDELGLEPGQALQQLEKAILVQDPALDPPLEAQRPRSPARDRSSREPAGEPARCDTCGAANEPSARFCHACGAELGAELEIELRKTVTVLFCDVVTSTELGERLDPESMRRLMSRYFEEASAVLDRHGGTVEKFIGDEVMAVFGVPAVRQDDALRAVRAAAELRERLSALSVPEWDTRLQVRIGVNTGEVVAGDPSAGHAFVTGDAVVVGKRLEQAAQPGEVLLGTETYALVAHAVEAEPLGPLPAKNKREGVTAYRLDRVDPDPQPFPPRQDVPLVGRDAELQRLLARYALAASGGVQLVTVVGQAGIGKSRLVRELAARVGGEAAVLVGRCRPYGEGITFWPLRELLAQAGRDDMLEGSGHEIFAAARRALEELAAGRPLVAVFEDVHWAEPTLLDLVEYLAARLGDARILLLCLARPELEERRPEWLRDALVLEPLTGAESETLLEELGAPEEVRPRIAEAAEGNPLFVEQLAAAAGERGDAAELPASLRGVLAERLDRLDREERAVLERAAVAGREFSLDWVVHLSPPRLRDRAPARLLALARKELVVADPDASAEEGFRFRHALIRDAAYDGMPKVIRAALHEQMAARLEAEGHDDALIGYHLERAYRHREQLGRVDPATIELGTRAGKLLAAAGKVAFDRSDLPAAISLLGRATALLPADDPLQPGLLTDLAHARISGGDFAQAEADADAAAAAAARLGDRRTELHALIERQFARSWVAPRAAAAENVRLAQAVLPELEALGDDLGIARAWWLKSEGDVFACRWRERAEALDRARAAALAGRASRDQVNVISGLLAQALLYGPTPVPAAIARTQELLSEAGTDRVARAAVGTSHAGLLAMQGASDEARRVFADSIAIYEEFGVPLRRAVQAPIGARIELLAGDVAAAERELRAAAATAGELGARGVGATIDAILADVLCTLDRMEEAERIARDVADEAPEDDLVPQVLWRSSLARVLARKGRADEAVGLAAEALRLTAKVEFPDLRVAALTAAAEVATARGRAADARRRLGEAREIMTAKENRVAVELLEAALSRPLSPAAREE